jgi:ferritin-like metal-binding protein YciE
MNHEELTELLLQSLEHEKGGVQVYETALRCALNNDLRMEWEEYLEQTRNHVQILQSVCERLGIDTEEASAGCEVIRHLGSALVQAMTLASGAGDREAAQLVACECVVLAETKDHLDWELLGKCAEEMSGDNAKILEAACDEVEEEEDEHLYHSKGWCRELWLESLGMKAILPPPEERKDVKTAIGAARAQQESERSR